MVFATDNLNGIAISEQPIDSLSSAIHLVAVLTNISETDARQAIVEGKATFEPNADGTGLILTDDSCDRILRPILYRKHTEIKRVLRGQSGTPEVPTPPKPEVAEQGSDGTVAETAQEEEAASETPSLSSEPSFTLKTELLNGWKIRKRSSATTAMASVMELIPESDRTSFLEALTSGTKQAKNFIKAMAERINPDKKSECAQALTKEAEALVAKQAQAA